MVTTRKKHAGPSPQPPGLEARDSGVIAVTPDGVVVGWDPSAEKVLGYTAAQMMGRNLTTFFRAPGMEEVLRLLDRVHSTQQVETLMIELCSKGGKACRIWLTVIPIWWDAQGQVKGLAIAAPDPSGGPHRQVSPQRLAHCFEHVGAAIAIVKEEDLTYELVNPAYARMHGYTPDEIEGRSVRDAVPPDCHARLEAEIRRAALLGHTVVEYFHVRRDGTRFPVLVDATAVKDEEGTVLYRVLSVHDLSELKKLEQDARLYRDAALEAKRLEAVFASSVDGLLVADSSGHVVLANDRAAWIFRVPKDDLLIPLSEYPGRFEPEAAEEPGRLSSLARRALSGETVDPVERRIEAGDGTERFLRSGAAPLRDESGRIWGAVVVIGDITDRKRAEAEVLNLNRTLERRVEERTRELTAALEELGAFAYTVAHDLRAPLRALHAFSDILAEEYRGRPLDSEGLLHLDRIREASRRMDALLHGILHYSRLGRIQSASGPTGLGEAVAVAVTEVGDQVRSSGGRIDVRAPMPKVQGNCFLLLQALINLLSNALKFVAPGTKPRVEVWAVPERGRVRLNVKDNGIGIREEYFGRIFGVFERLNTAESYPGTGIGLAIVRRAVERMGGTVGLQSTPGQGSTFWIELPGADSEDAPAP